MKFERFDYGNRVEYRERNDTCWHLTATVTVSQEGIKIDWPRGRYSQDEWNEMNELFQQCLLSYRKFSHSYGNQRTNFCDDPDFVIARFGVVGSGQVYGPFDRNEKIIEGYETQKKYHTEIIDGKLEIVED